MLELTHVSKRYGETTEDFTLALNSVNLTVAEGEIVCLLGPSGCGKTTLLRVVAGLEEADEGEIRLKGKDLSRVPVHLRHFGYMFQDFALFPHKSVAENIAFGLKMDNMRQPAVDARVVEMLELVGLTGYGRRSIFELSGGERQRVALARSLAPNPQIVLLDEPLGSLDRTLRESLTAELRHILKQVDVTAVYVTHDQEEAFTIADRIAVMLAGEIAQIEPPEGIYAAPKSAAIARFLGFSSLLPIHLSADVKSNNQRYVRTPIGEFPHSYLSTEVPSEGGLLLIRPDSARVSVDPDEPAVEYPYLIPVQDERGNTLRLTARLEEVSFRGSQYRITVCTPEGESVNRLTFDLPAYQSNVGTGSFQRLPLPEVGKPIVLTIYPELTSVLPLET